MSSKKPGKRQRSVTKSIAPRSDATAAKATHEHRKDGAGKRSKAAPGAVISSLRHIALSIEEGTPSASVIDFLICKTTAAAPSYLCLHDSKANAADVLAAVSSAGEIVSSEPVALSGSLAGAPAAKGSSSADWHAMRVTFDSPAAWKRLRGLGRPAEQVGDDGKPIGMAKWVAAAEAMLPDPASVAKEADAAMAAFEAAERDVERRRKLIAGRPDEDGFITVVPKGRGRSKAEKAAAAASAGPDAWGYMSANRKSKAKKAAMEDTDFYSFQKRESKISELEELRKKFEADKERVRKMRQGRTFNPV